MIKKINWWVNKTVRWTGKSTGVKISEKEQLIITHEDIKKELEADIEELKVKSPLCSFLIF